MSKSGRCFERTKRKKKRSRMQTLKKMKCVKGIDLESDMREYFIRVLIREEQEFDSLEDKRVFVENVMDQLTGNEVIYSSNQLVSRVIEKLLPYTSNGVLQKFMEEFGKDLRPICVDSYCSHVLQQLILVVAMHAVGNEIKVEDGTTSDSNFKQDCVDWLIKVSRFVFNNIEEFAWDSCANHVIRTLITVLAGLRKDQNETECRVRKAEIQKAYAPPEDFINMLKDFTSRIISWPQFADLGNDCLTSVLLQDLLKGLKLIDKKLMKKVIKHFLSIHLGSEENNVEVLPEIFYSNSGIHVIETVIEVSGKKLQSKIYNKCFYRRLMQLSQKKNTNFAVQKMLACCKDKTLFESIANELLTHTEEILNSKNTGVVLNLCQACERFESKQDDFVRNLRKALGCSDPEINKDNFVMCVLQLSAFTPNNMIKSDYIHLHGSLILQSMLCFRKPMQVVNSLLYLKPDVLTLILSDSKGSHIADAFAASPFIGKKSHERLTKYLLGYYVSLATSKHGSRSFDAIWSIATVNCKVEIANELCNKMSLVTSNKCGERIALKISLSTFCESKDEWKKTINEMDTKRKMFCKIISD